MNRTLAQVRGMYSAIKWLFLEEKKVRWATGMHETTALPQTWGWRVLNCKRGKTRQKPVQGKFNIPVFDHIFNNDLQGPRDMEAMTWMVSAFNLADGKLVY